MIREYKNNYYKEIDEYCPKVGDLVVAGGTVGVLRSDWGPAAIQIETDRGKLFQLAEGCPVKLLRPVKLNNK